MGGRRCGTGPRGRRRGALRRGALANWPVGVAWQTADESAWVAHSSPSHDAHTVALRPSSRPAGLGDGSPTGSGAGARQMAAWATTAEPGTQARALASVRGSCEQRCRFRPHIVESSRLTPCPRAWSFSGVASAPRPTRVAFGGIGGIWGRKGAKGDGTGHVGDYACSRQIICASHGIGRQLSDGVEVEADCRGGGLPQPPRPGFSPARPRFSTSRVSTLAKHPSSRTADIMGIGHDADDRLVRFLSPVHRNADTRYLRTP